MKVIPPLGFVIAICAAFAAHVWIATSQPKMTGSQVPVEALRADTPQGTEFSAADMSDLVRAKSLFVTRPLLAEGRRMASAVVAEPAPIELPVVAVAPPPTVEEITPPAPEVPNIQMVGVMETATEIRALIRDLTDGSERWVSKGDAIGPWTLINITQVGMLVAIGDQEITFQLFQQSLP